MKKRQLYNFIGLLLCLALFSSCYDEVRDRRSKRRAAALKEQARKRMANRGPRRVLIGTRKSFYRPPSQCQKYHDLIKTLTIRLVFQFQFAPSYLTLHFDRQNNRVVFRPTITTASILSNFKKFKGHFKFTDQCTLNLYFKEILVVQGVPKYYSGPYKVPYHFQLSPQIAQLFYKSTPRPK